MKKKKYAARFAALLLGAMLLFSGLGYGSVYGKEADFVMTESVLPISAKEIYDLDGAIQRDGSKFIPGPDLSYNQTETQPEFDGQFFIHAGAGDRFTFDVDFSNLRVAGFSYRTYGQSAVPTEFQILADGVLLAECTATGGVAWEPTDFNLCPVTHVNFQQQVSGLKKVEIVITSSAPEWPANNIGCFTFCSDTAIIEDPSLFVMENGRLGVSANQIILYGTVERNEQLFQNDGHAISCNTAAQLEYSGQFFIHAGKGDRFTFQVDFGDYEVSAFSFMSYGMAELSTMIELYIDGDLVGTGEGISANGWEPEDYDYCWYDEIHFEQSYSGKKEITIYLSDSSEAWPANNVGCFTFLAEDADTPEPAPPTRTPAVNTPSAAVTETPAGRPVEGSLVVWIIVAVCIITIAAAVVWTLLRKKK